MKHGRSLKKTLFGLTALCGLFAPILARDAAAAPDADHPQVVLETSYGPITLELDRTKAPISVDNFLKYVDDGFYNNLIFHRVISDFMIQGGGFDDQMKEKPNRPPIKNERGNGLSNTRGTIAMARTPDLNSATSQFYINLFDKNQFLDTLGGGYAVFGKVVAGMDAVDAIAKVQTGQKGGTPDVPLKPVYIKTAKRKPSS